MNINEVISIEEAKANLCVDEYTQKKAAQLVKWLKELKRLRKEKREWIEFCKGCADRYNGD